MDLTKAFEIIDNKKNEITNVVLKKYSGNISYNEGGIHSNGRLSFQTDFFSEFELLTDKEKKLENSELKYHRVDGDYYYAIDSNENLEKITNFLSLHNIYISKINIKVIYGMRVISSIKLEYNFLENN